LEVRIGYGIAAPLAIDQERDFPARERSGLRDRMNRRNRRGLRERLADVPRPLLLAHVVLQVAARHVEADRIAEDKVLGISGCDVRTPFAYRHDELELVMQIARRHRVGDATHGGWNHRHDGIGRFREEEWRLLRRVSAHFLRVLGVIAPDAIDVTDRKELISADGRNGRQIPGGHGVLHASHSSSSCRALADERTEPPISHSASG
jgi:hypothetical protein